MYTFIAVTRLTLIELMRRRIPLAMSLFFLVMVYTIPHIVIGDGTVKGVFQLTLSYTLGFTAFFLALFNMLVAVNLLRREWREKIIFVLDAKPAARWQVLLGKFCGLSILNAFLVLVVCGLTLLNIDGMRDDFSQAAQTAQRPSTPGDFADAEATVLSARSPLRPVLNDDLKRAYSRSRRTISVRPGGWFNWEFRPTSLPTDVSSYTLRYKFYAATTSETSKVQAIWLIGDPSVDGGFIRLKTTNSINLFHEIAIPAQLVKEGQTLHVSLGNANSESMVLNHKDGMVLLVEDRSFAFNVIVAFFVVFVQVLLLSAVGLALSTCLSSQVSLLALLALYFILISGGMLKDLANPKESSAAEAQQESLVEKGFNIYSESLATALGVAMPDYMELAPTDRISRGVSLSWGYVLWDNLWAIGLRIFALLALGAAIFRSRELGMIRDIS